MNAEISVLHRHIWPNARDQFPLSDDFSSPLNQRDQRVERATTEQECLVPFLELPLDREQAKRAKRDDAMHQRAVAIHVHPRVLRHGSLWHQAWSPFVVRPWAES